MQIWYLFKVSASEEIPLQHRKDGNKHVDNFHNHHYHQWCTGDANMVFVQDLKP